MLTMQQIKKAVLKKRLLRYKGNILQACKSLDMNRNVYSLYFSKEELRALKTHHIKHLLTDVKRFKSLRQASSRLKIPHETLRYQLKKLGFAYRKGRLDELGKISKT